MPNPFKKLAKTKTKAPKKSDIPEITDVDEDLSKSVREWIAADIKMKDAEASKKMAEAPILDKACEAHGEICLDEKEYHSSIKLLTNEGNLLVSFANKYSNVATDNEEELRQIYGDEYDRYFNEKTTVTLTPAAMEDEKFVAMLSDKLGPEKFARYFNVTEHLEVAKSYHENRMTDKVLAGKHQMAVDAGLIKCNKPSVKKV